jgi:hypothetical protein
VEEVREVYEEFGMSWGWFEERLEAETAIVSAVI